jgi:two-component system chemotaxis response regulator CheB
MTLGQAGSTGSGVIRVMLVDDSAVIRGLFTRSIEADREIEVVASVSDGQMAVNALKRHKIDVAVLDIEMPVMDGLTALPLLLQIDPTLQIIMASTLTRKNAEVSMRALRDGAKDYVTKPSTTSELTSAENFKQELIAKIKALAGSRRSPRSVQRAETVANPVASSVSSSYSARSVTAPAPSTPVASDPARPLALKSVSREMPEIIAIGSSTGGPQALFAVLGGLRPEIRQPILITQHMPATFTTILAEHLARVTNRPCQEGRTGDIVQPGHIYIAPGDFHMVVEPAPAGKTIKLLTTPPENYCRPSVDPMLRSLARIYGARMLVIILTGMGKDGMLGSSSVVEGGGTVIAQDEATSVVWGMPGAVANAGLCAAVLPLPEIAGFVNRHLLRSAL